jgi:hypothetical protein
MNDGEAQPATSLQHAGGFLDGGRHLVHILKGHERNDAIERPVREGQSGRICEAHVDRRVDQPGGRQHRRRHVHPDDTVPHCLEVPRDSSFPAS